MLKANDFSTLIDGSGEIDLAVEAANVQTMVAGSGDIKLAVETSNVQAMIDGSGDISITGTTSNLKVNLSGSGDFNGFDLISQNTSVSISGSGSAGVFAQTDLTAIISGSGDVIYKGDPDQKDIKTYGAGEVSSYWKNELIKVKNIV